MAIETAIAQIQDVLGSIPTVRSAPDEPPEQLNAFPFVVVYPGTGTYIGGNPAGVVKALHSLIIEVHVARKLLPRDVRTLLPFGDIVPVALEKALQSRELPALNIQTFGDITYTFGSLGWANFDTIGWRFVVPGLKYHMATNSLLDNLIAYYQMDEASPRLDSTANSYDLTDNNTVGQDSNGVGVGFLPFVRAVNPAALFVAANNEFLSHPSNADFTAFGGSDATWAAWIKPTASSDGQAAIVAKTTGGGGTREFRIFYTKATGQATFEVTPSGTPSPNISASTGLATVTQGAWNLVVVEYLKTLTAIRIRVNNGPTTTTVDAALGTLVGGGTQLTIGAKDAGAADRFDGSIDQVGYWHRLLSAAEITALYNGGGGIKWPFYDYIELV